MKRFILILVCLIATPALAQITSVSVVGLTPTQAIIQFNDATSTFTLAVSESASYSPVVADVDTTKFGANANNSTRALNPTGTTWQFVVGSIPSVNGKLNNLSIEATPLVYGRALRPNTPHYFKITDGANTATGSFTTPNLRLGKTYGEPAPIIGGATTWQATTSYSPGNLVLDSNGYIEQAQGPGPGTSGGSSPTWAAPGATTTDSGVTWLNKGTMWGFPSMFTAAQWALTNPKTFQMRDPNTGVPIQFVTTPTDFTSDVSSHAFTAVGTCTNWTNASNLLSNSAFATVTTSDKCAVIQGNTSFSITNIYYTDAVQLILAASSTNAGDKLDACVTLDGATCATPSQQFTLTASTVTYCFPVTAACGTTPRPNPWSSDWNGPLAPVLNTTITATTQQKPGTTGISANSNFGFLVWKDPSASGTISAQNVKTNIYASQHVTGSYPNGGEEWMCEHAGTVNDGNGVAGYLCMEGYASGRTTIFWINPTNGEVRNIGLVSVGTSNLPAGITSGVPTAPTTESFDANVPNIAYFVVKDTSVNHKAHVLSCTLPASGSATYNANAAVNTNVPCTWVDMTPDVDPTCNAGNCTLQDQVAKFDATYSPTTYKPGGVEGVSGYLSHSYLITDGLSGNQNAPGWMIAFDVNAANPSQSGVVAATPTFVDANPTNSTQVGCRWCGFHTIHNPGDTHFVLWAPHTANATAVGGGFGTDITAGVLDAAINTSVTTFQIDVDANFLQPPLANDFLNLEINTGNSECMQIQSVAAGGASNQPGFPTTYSVTVVSRNSNMGGGCVSGSHSHSAGVNAQMQCDNTYSGGKGGLFWWDFINDPHGMVASPGMLLEADSMSAHYAYTAAGTGNVTIGDGISETSDWSTCYNYSPGTNCPGGASVTTGQPAFNTVTVDTSGNAYQRHPTSVHQVKATGNELLWGGDIQVSNAISWASPVSLTLVSGNLYSFTPGSSGTYTYNYKKLDTLAMAGSHPLIDISGPSSVIDGTTASSYKWCYVFVAGECVGGSTVGTVYANAPFFTTTSFCGNGGFAANGWLAYTESQLCFINYGGLTDNIAQVKLSTADATGANSRSLGLGMSTAGFHNGYSNPQPDPSGQNMFFPLSDPNGRQDVLEMVGIPPFPNSSLNNDFIQLSVASGTPPGGTNSCMVEFGYDTNLQATGRAEKTVTVATTYSQANPFYFETSDSYTRPGCASATTLIVPVIPGHVVYYRFVFCSNASPAVCTVNGGTQPTNVAADPSFPTNQPSNSLVAPCPACFVENLSHEPHFAN